MDTSTEWLLSCKIETVGLPLRISNILRRHHINTVGEMLRHHHDEYRQMSGFGRTSMATIDRFVNENDLSWKEND